MDELIYIIYADEPGMRCIFKIGITTIDGLKTRLAGIQCGNPFKLRILKTFQIKGAGRYEYILHTILKRFRMEGERFELGGEMLDYVFRQIDIWKSIQTINTNNIILKGNQDIQKIWNGGSIDNIISIDTYEDGLNKLAFEQEEKKYSEEVKAYMRNLDIKRKDVIYRVKKGKWRKPHTRKFYEAKNTKKVSGDAHKMD